MGAKEILMGEEIRKCPKCGDKMGKQIIKGVVIDKCVRCYSIFLDWGEFERLDDETIREKLENFILEIKNALNIGGDEDEI